MHQTYMSCQSQLEQSTAKILHQDFPTYSQTQSSTIAVDWGDDNRITIWNQMRKSFLARDYALNRSSTPAPVCRAIQQNPRRIMCAQSLLSSTFTLYLVITRRALTFMKRTIKSKYELPNITKHM